MNEYLDVLDLEFTNEGSFWESLIFIALTVKLGGGANSYIFLYIWDWFDTQVF